MEFGWSEHQLKLHKAAREFAERELNDFEKADDAEPFFDRKNWQHCADFGVQGAYLPRSLGGQEHDVTTTIFMLEGIGAGCRDNGLTLGLNGHMWAVMEPVFQFGTEEQKQRFLPGMCNGELMGAHGMTEPGSGSDAYSLSTTAVPVDGGYLLNGQKIYIGLAPCCDVALVFASTAPEKGQWGLSAFLVERGFDGFKTTGARTKMGLSGGPMGEITLENCFVPESNRLGPEGAGVSIFGESMEWERSFIFASHVGAMSRQLEQATKYAKERRQFGQHIGSFQSVSNRLADMKLRLETARLMLYRAAWLKQTGQRIPMDAALTKLNISEAFVASSLDALRIHGAAGYMQGAAAGRDLRDATGGVIYSGTSDIQRQLVAKLLGV